MLSSGDIERLIVGECLNENYPGLKSLINDTIQIRHTMISSVNFNGHSGESPAHIAIYKNDETMLKIIISGGVNPNFKNTAGETLIHTASKLGRFSLLVLLYETGLCNLDSKDDVYGFTPLEMLQSIPYNEDVVVASRLYKNWALNDPFNEIETECIIDGRRQCEEYLIEKVRYDHEMKVIRLTREAIDWTLEREKHRRIVSSDSSTETDYSIRYHGPYISYPEKEGKCAFDESERDFFDHYRKGIHSLATKAFSQQIYLNAVNIGSSKAHTTLTSNEETTEK
jgi:hypothetical protein